MYFATCRGKCCGIQGYDGATNGRFERLRSTRLHYPINELPANARLTEILVDGTIEGVRLFESHTVQDT